MLKEPSVIAMIAYAHEKPVGVMVLNECAAIYAGGRFAEISELYVLPEMRSQGVAPQLLKAAVAEAANRDWKRIEVGAPPQPAWKRTMNFYLRNGFTEVGPRLRKVI
nr:GNAT family N-acetyltransferase [Kordiimonas lacus]